MPEAKTVNEDFLIHMYTFLCLGGVVYRSQQGLTLPLHIINDFYRFGFLPWASKLSA